MSIHTCRASTGFGKRWLTLGDAKWGDTMQQDLTDAVVSCMCMYICVCIYMQQDFRDAAVSEVHMYVCIYVCMYLFSHGNGIRVPRN